MKKILIVGATGFIGKEVADYLSQKKDFEVVRYTRQPRLGFFCCEIGDQAWQRMVSDCVAIINCAGVGLAKIKRQKGANESIARRLAEALPSIEGKKHRLLHLSSIKAFNANNYKDAYSVDKRRAEQVFIEYEDNLCGELLRIPAVFGAGDENLAALVRMAEKNRLPQVQGDICSWYCISRQNVARYIEGWLNKQDEQTLTFSYLLSQQRYSINDLIRLINNHVHGQAYRAKKRKLFYIRGLYTCLALRSYFSSGFRWNRFPSERFQDLFERVWEIENSQSIAIHTVNFESADIWKGT